MIGVKDTRLRILLLLLITPFYFYSKQATLNKNYLKDLKPTLIIKS